MLVGYPPFFDESPFRIYEKILEGKVQFPKWVDGRAKDLIKGIIYDTVFQSATRPHTLYSPPSRETERCGGGGGGGGGARQRCFTTL